MTTTQLRQALLAELARAEADARKSDTEDDFAYHNGEVDGLGFALEILKKVI